MYSDVLSYTPLIPYPRRLGLITHGLKSDIDPDTPIWMTIPLLTAQMNLEGTTNVPSITSLTSLQD